MRALRFLASVVLPTLALAAVGQGCIIGDCDNGQDNCVQIEPATKYTLAPETKTAAWTTGQGVRIVSANGQVNVRQGSSSEVSATFTAFTLNKDDKEDEARREMTENLEVSVSDSGGQIVVEVRKLSGANGGTGADIDVKLPAGFDGAFEVVQDNGSVEADLSGSTPASTRVINDGAGSLAVSGARGALEITASTGDVDVSVAVWPTVNGSVYTDNGDINITVPSEADGSISLTADGEVTESGVPATWVATADGYTMGAGTGGAVDVTTDFGDIVLTVE